MYSNKCSNKKCVLNLKTKRCSNQHNLDTNIKTKNSSKCICNIESGRCIKSKELDIDIKKGKKKVKIEDAILTSLEVKRCKLKGFGITSLESIKNSFDLPESSYLKFAIIKYNKECIVYNKNDKIYNIHLSKDNELIIKLPNYDILVKPNRHFHLDKFKSV